MKRTGPQMLAAVRYVAAHPGCPKVHVADSIGPNGSRRYGYYAVERTIRAGLIAAELTPRGYKLTVTEAGERAL